MTDEELQRLLALDGAPGPALAIDAAHADAIVDAALGGAGFGPGGGGSGGARASGGGGAAGMKLAIVAGAVVVVVAIALLAGRAMRRSPEQLATLIVDAPTDVFEGSSTASPGGQPASAATDPPPAADPPLVEMSAEDEATPSDPSASDRPSRAKPPRRNSDAADATADLLGEANAKRAAKQWRESDALYARVVQRAPKSLAAQTALVASASLRLEHLGDPKGAAQRFRRALAIAPAGALAEDARWGLAEAARANHDPTAEAAALDDFLAHHGRSPLAERARARRAELP